MIKTNLFNQCQPSRLVMKYVVYPQEGNVNEVTNQVRGLCLSGPSSGGDSSSDLTTVQVSTAPAPQNCVVPRQPYTQVSYVNVGIVVFKLGVHTTQLLETS